MLQSTANTDHAQHKTKNKVIQTLPLDSLFDFIPPNTLMSIRAMSLIHPCFCRTSQLFPSVHFVFFLLRKSEQPSGGYFARIMPIDAFCTNFTWIMPADVLTRKTWTWILPGSYQWTFLTWKTCTWTMSTSWTIF